MTKFHELPEQPTYNDYTTLYYTYDYTATTLHCVALHYKPHYTSLSETSLHYTTLHYNTIHYNTIQYNTIQYNTLPNKNGETNERTGKTIYKTPTKLSLFVLNSLPVSGFRYRVLFNTSIVGNSSTEIPEFLRL